MISVPRIFCLKGKVTSALSTVSHVLGPLSCCEQRLSIVTMTGTRGMGDKNHASVTVASPKQPVLTTAQILDVEQITPSVKKLLLRVDEKRFGFQPGQWVDFHAPGLTTLGGFSVVSPPSQLTSSGTIEIAVKRSQHPPAHWVHTQAEAGVHVQVQVGGDFLLNASDMQRPLLFLAGGIGITPMMSMLSHYVEMVPELLQANKKPHAILLYSSSTVEELAFRSQLELLCKGSSGALDVTFFVTRGTTSNDMHDGPAHMQYRRLKLDDLEKFLEQEDASHTKDESKGPVIFMCGPPGMVDCFQKHAESLGVPSGNIRSEQWW